MIDAETLRRLAVLDLPKEAFQEVLSILADVQAKSEARRKSAQERTAKWREGQKRHGDVTVTAQERHGDCHDADAPSSSLPSLPECSSTALKEERKEEALESGRARESKTQAKLRRGTRLPVDWEPSQADRVWAAEQIGEASAVRELTKFRDWWAQAPGQKGVKVDWDATWRTWIHRVIDQLPRAPPANVHRIPTTKERKQDEWDAARQKLRDSIRRDRSGEGNGGPPAGLFPPLASERS